MRNLVAALPVSIALLGGGFVSSDLTSPSTTSSSDVLALTVRVVDVGPGLCTVTGIPGGHFMVFDAGHWIGKDCLEAAREMIGTNPIDLMIISHSDGDHLGDADDILKEFEVKKVIRTGFVREDAANWRNMNNEIAKETMIGASVQNLKTSPLVPGTRLQLGEASVTLIAGWHEWDQAGPNSAEMRNVISIVAKLEYRGSSVLFTGDTVGRRLTDDDNACKDAESVIVGLHDAGSVNLKSDVIIAPHHGGNNGSSRCFVSRVDPEFVVFSAGHSHQHPTKSAANRYLQQGVETSKIFRTDRGDDESGVHEWKEGSIPDCEDPRADDDIEISIDSEGYVAVRYLRPQDGC